MKSESDHSKQEDELLTPEEALAKLRLQHKDWLYQHVHAGTLPFPYCKIGRYLRFPASGIRAYIQSQTRQSA
jgi:predicted DNA-binding transcriptional regulator AlpA